LGSDKNGANEFAISTTFARSVFMAPSPHFVDSLPNTFHDQNAFMLPGIWLKLVIGSLTILYLPWVQYLGQSQPLTENNPYIHIQPVLALLNSLIQKP
jgi:hypothetical protein